MIVDDRTESEVEETGGFVIATDSFMSGWGECENGGRSNGGRSIVARPVKHIRIDTPNGNAMGTDHYYDVDWNELKRVESVFNSHPEFKRVRIAYGKVYKPRMDDGDHLHIYGFDTFK